MSATPASGPRWPGNEPFRDRIRAVSLGGVARPPIRAQVFVLGGGSATKLKKARRIGRPHHIGRHVTDLRLHEKPNLPRGGRSLRLFTTGFWRHQMPGAEIAAGWAALNAAMDIAKGLKSIDDRVKLNAAVIELQQKILDAQASNSAATRRVDELEKALDRHTRWSDLASKYRLKDFGGSTFAYEYLSSADDETPSHIACPKCFEEERRSILQFGNESHGQSYFKCPACGKTFALGKYVPSPPRTRRSEWL